MAGKFKLTAIVDCSDLETFDEDGENLVGVLQDCQADAAFAVFKSIVESKEEGPEELPDFSKAIQNMKKENYDMWKRLLANLKVEKL